MFDIGMYISYNYFSTVIGNRAIINVWHRYVYFLQLFLHRNLKTDQYKLDRAENPEKVHM